MQHDVLQCGVQTVLYDYDTGIAHFVIDPDNCPDMMGAIAVAEAISPEAKCLVFTDGEGRRVSVYERVGRAWFCRYAD